MTAVPPLLRRLLHEEDAQSIVEFALILPILMYVLMGIIEFGFVFNAYVTMSNAVREGARDASFYPYDNNSSLSTNDTNRHNRLEDSMVAARGILNMGASRTDSTTNFAHTATYTGNCSTNAACSVTDGDVTITYTIPSGVTANDARRGYQMAVEAIYHERLFIPLLWQFMPDDPSPGKGAPWLRVIGRITVVIN